MMAGKHPEYAVPYALRAGVCIFTLCVATSHAGPLATATFSDGTSRRVEILEFESGWFKLRNTTTDTEIFRRAHEIKALDFGSQPEIEKPNAVATRRAVETFRHLAEERQYAALLTGLTASVALGNRDPVAAFAEEMKKRLSDETLASEARRDCRLALAAAYFAQRDRERGRAELLEINSDYPGDPEVHRFLIELVRFVRELNTPATEPRRPLLPLRSPR